MSERRRAGDVRQSMMRGMAVPPRPSPHDDDVTTAGEGEQPIPAPPPQPARPKQAVPAGTTKFTASVDADTAAEFDGLALAARRRLGRRVDKVEILKALIRLAADDASLKDQVISEVEQSGR